MRNVSLCTFETLLSKNHWRSIDDVSINLIILPSDFRFPTSRPRSSNIFLTKLVAHRGADQIRPHILIIDEWWRVVHHQEPRSAKDLTQRDILMEELKDLAVKILREGRGVGFFVVCLSQSPRADEIKIDGAEDSFA